MRNREFVFAPKIEYELVAERSEANQNSLTFPFWCSILELVRTHFAACGGEKYSNYFQYTAHSFSRQGMQPSEC